MKQQKQNNKSKKSFFQSDRPILFVCIGIALIFWILIKLSQNYRTKQEFALNYNLPEGKTFTDQPPQSIVATLDGQGWDLMSNYFNGDERKLLLNLNNSSQQTYNSSQLVSKLTPNNKDIVINGINIDLLMLNVEEEISKKVPVVLNSEFEFNSQYQLKQAVQLTPDSVEIKGPTSVVGAIEQWKTELWALKNINADQEKRLGVMKPENILTKVAPLQIEAKLSAEQLTEKSLFVPIFIKNAPDSLKIFPENIKLSCIVGLGRYNDISPNSFTLEVDLNGIALNASNNTLPILLTRQPDFVKGVTMSYQSVEFFFVNNQMEETSDSSSIETSEGQN